MLSKSGNPSLDSLAAVLNACGLRGDRGDVIRKLRSLSEWATTHPQAKHLPELQHNMIASRLTFGRGQATALHHFGPRRFMISSAWPFHSA
jgi:hypothetical protein